MWINRRSRLVVVMVVVGGLACVAWWYRRDHYPITNAHPRGSRLIALGDSLTFGSGADRGEDYVSQLSRRLGVEILNKGVPGDTTGDALERLDEDALRLDPKIVILLIGGNDFLQRLSSERMFENIDRIVTRVQNEGALVVLVGMKAPLGLGEGGFRKIARRRGCLYVRNVLRGILGNRTLMADQIHPNGAGYALMAERIAEVVRPYLRSSE